MRKTIVTLALLLAATAFAQEDQPREPKRDPFATTEKLKQRQPDFVPDDEPEALPELVLRGYIEDGEGQTAALLEVDGKSTYLVRKDDTVSLPQRGRNLVLVIAEMTQLSLRVEVGAMRRVVVVR